MATLIDRGSGTPTTTGTTWTNLANAVDGTPGTNNATYAVWTSSQSGGVATIEVSGYGPDFAAAIGVDDTLNSVTVSARSLVSNTSRISTIVMQPFDGATPIGSAFTCSKTTGAANDTTTFPVTKAQLQSATFKVRMTITRAAVTQSATFSLDYIDVTADYTAFVAPVDLVVDDAGHGVTSDNVTIQEVLPPVDLVVQDAAHAHFTQQPREDYFIPSAANTLSSPDWGAMPATFCFLTKSRDGTQEYANYSMASQAPNPPQNSWALGRANTGLWLNYSADGSSSMAVAAGVGAAPAPHPYRTDYFAYVYAGTSATNGLQQWRSADNGATWTLQSNHSGAGVAFFDSTAAIKIGTLSAYYPGDIFWIEMRSGTDPNGGTVLWRFDASEHVSGTSWVDARGKTWTLSTAAAITHIPATSDITIANFPPTNLVVQDAYHSFVNQPDTTPYLHPSISRATTADPGNFIGDDFVLVTRARGPVIGASAQNIASQNPASPNQAWRVNRTGPSGTSTQGALQAAFYPNGTVTGSFNAPSSATNNGITLDTVNAQLLAYAYNKATGAWRSMLSTDGGATWPVVRSGTATTMAAFFDSTGPVWIGADGPGGISSIWDGQINWVEARSGIDPLAGTLLWRFDASEHVSGLSWVDARGRTWSVTNAAGIVRPVTDTPTIEHVVPAVVTPDNCFHSVVSTSALEAYITPSSTAIASTPDPGPLPNTYTFVFKIFGPTSGTSGQVIASQWSITSGDNSWQFHRMGSATTNNPGNIYVWYSSDGSGSASGPGSGAVTPPNQQITEYFSLQVTRNPSAIALYRSLNGGNTWVLVGSASYGGNEAPWDSSLPIRIGTAASTYFPGRIYYVELRDGLGPAAGNVVWRFDATEHVAGNTSWVGRDGRTWTLNGASTAITHVGGASDVVITHIPAVNLVVANCQHAFTNQIDMSPWLAPLVGRASTPDPADLPTTGFVFVMKTRGLQDTSVNSQGLVSQDRASPQKSFNLQRRGDGNYTLVSFPDGSNTQVTAVTGAQQDDPDRVNPEFHSFSYIGTSGAWATKRSADGGSTYAAISASTGTITSFFSSTDPLTIGAIATGSTWIWDDKIYWIELRTGIDPKAGTLLWRFDASEHISGTGWTDARGNVWTLTNAAALVRPAPTEPTVEVQVAPTLANLDSYHAVDSGTPALTQIHVLAVDNATHAQVADSPAFTQVHVLVVAGAAHTQVSDSPPLTQVHVLTVAGAAHAQAVDHVAINTATNVLPADAAHAIISDSPAITQVHVLVVANAAHAVTSDSPPITQVHVLTVAGATQAHTADAPSITQVHILTVQSAVHAHIADNVGITQVHALVVQSAEHTTFSPDLGLSTEGVVAGADTYHSITSSTPALTQVHNLVVQNALHGHAATSSEIVVNINIPAVASAVHAHIASNVALIVDIPVHSALHAHTADHVPITVRSDLVVASAAHAQTASSATLTQVHVLAVADAVHAQATSGITLTQVHILAVQSTLHVHSADNIDFTQVHFLAAVANALHAHSADEDLPITQEHYLTVAWALHEHTADEFTLEYIVWLDVDDAYHALLGPEVNLAGIVTLNEALALYLGSRAVQAVYLGTSKVWP